MTKSTLFRSVFALTLALLPVQSSQAKPTLGAGDGTWRCHICPGQNSNPTAQFIQLTAPGQQGLGFGGTNTVAQLIVDNNPGQTAGVTLKFKYTAADSTRANDFNDFQFLYNPGGNNGVKKNTIVTFCFQEKHGSGNLVSLPVSLKNISAEGPDAGFFFADQNSMNFNGFFASSCVLRKVSFALTGSASNLQIGNTTLTCGLGNQITPVRVNFAEANCAGLDTCDASD